MTAKQLPLYVTKMEDDGKRSPTGSSSGLGSPDSYGSKSPPTNEAMEKAIEKGMARMSEELKFPKQIQDAVSTVLKG